MANGDAIYYKTVMELETPEDRCSNCKSVCRRMLIGVALGQTLSLCISGTAICSGFLQQKGVNMPTAQSFLNYFLLCLVYTTTLACRKGDDNIVSIIKNRGWRYFLIAVVDVEANYLIVKAYQYTTVTSVQLLDCFTIPTVLALSWFFLRARYACLHLAGAGVCLLGVGAMVLADVLVHKNSEQASNQLVGDALCLAGALLYGVSNVAQEAVVKNFNRVEFLGMIGLFGSMVNGVQFAILERHEVLHVDFTSYKVYLPFLGFALSMFLLYSLMPIVLQVTSAASVNLNLLSADFYALLVGLFVFKYTFHFLYFISFVLIVVGIILYSIKPPLVAPEHGNANYGNVPVVDDAEESPAAAADAENGSSVFAARTAAAARQKRARKKSGESRLSECSAQVAAQVKAVVAPPVLCKDGADRTQLLEDDTKEDKG